MSSTSHTIPKTVVSYLHSFGLKDWELVHNEEKYNLIIVIPAIKEYKNIKTLLKSLNQCSSKYFDETLILFVVNNSSKTEEEIFRENQKTIELLKAIIFKDEIKNEGVVKETINRA